VGRRHLAGAAPAAVAEWPQTLLHPSQPVGSHGLSAREIEALRLVAAGKTNHAIATELFLSERMVHRSCEQHLRQVEGRSRTAAASYAIGNHIVDSRIL